VAAAASRRRGAAVLALTVLLAALALLTVARHVDAQVLCQDPDTGALEPCDTTTTDEPEDTVAPEEDGEEVVTQSTLTVTTLRNILIPGDGTEGAESTTTTEKALASGTDGLSDETLILLVVGGLGLVTAVVGVLTWRYWHATRPTVAQARPGR
jgi:hypothetical protein